MPPPPLASWSRVAGDKQPNLRLKWRHRTKNPPPIAQKLQWIYHGFTYCLRFCYPSSFQNPSFGSNSMQNCRCIIKALGVLKNLPCKLGPSQRGEWSKMRTILDMGTCLTCFGSRVFNIVDQLNPKIIEPCCRIFVRIISNSMHLWPISMKSWPDAGLPWLCL